MMRRIPLAGLFLALLGSCSIAWMPTNQWQPVPNPIMVEVNAYFAAVEQAQLTYDGDAIMAYYTPGVTFQLEDPDGVLLRTADAARVREGFVLPPGIDRSKVKHFSVQKVDFQYQPGPTDGQFAIRFQAYLLRPDGSVESMPAQAIACVFQRNSQGLQIELKIIRVLRGLPMPPQAVTPASSANGTFAGPPPIVPRTSPLRPDGPLAESSLVAAGDKLIEDEASGFRFRLRSDATVEKSVMTAGTGMTRYRCELSRDGISIVYDLFPLPGGRGVISPQQVQDLLALKPANIRRANGDAELGQQTLGGQPFDVRWYNEASESPGRPGRAYRWIGSRYALMVSITCVHPEDMNPVVEKLFRGIRFPEN